MAIFWFGKARGRRIVNYTTEEQRSEIEKESSQIVTLFWIRSLIHPNQPKPLFLPSNWLIVHPESATYGLEKDKYVHQWVQNEVKMDDLFT